MKIVLVGPIRHWYDKWGTPEHAAYIAWRDEVHEELIVNGHLVYSPHRAWQGAWAPDAQVVNDHAIEICDVVVNLSPPGVVRDQSGTHAELELAHRLGKRIGWAPPPWYPAIALQNLVAWLNEPSG